MKHIKHENDIWIAVNSPKYYNNITNKYKARGKEKPIYKLLTIGDINKLKIGDKIKLKYFHFYSDRWNNFTFTYDGFKKKDKYGFFVGKEYPNILMYVNKEKLFRISNSSDNSPVYVDKLIAPKKKRK